MKRGVVITLFVAFLLIASIGFVSAQEESQSIIDRILDFFRGLFGVEPRLAPICGDGLVESGENCDDGNLVNGDGCDNSCVIESGWRCFDVSPSICIPIVESCLVDSDCGETLVESICDSETSVLTTIITPSCVDSSCVYKFSSLGNTCPFTSCFEGACSNPISNCNDLQNMNNDLSGNYVLGGDVDCSNTVNWNTGRGFIPIGDSTNRFTGSFNGGNYKISNLYINDNTLNYAGLFGYVDSSTSRIENVGLENVDITGKSFIGAIVGRINGGTITNSYSTGSIKGTAYLGGLAGRMFPGFIITSYSEALVSNDGRTGFNIGGLVGDAYSGSLIKDSYATGNVIGDSYATGGIAGRVYDSTLENSYSTGNVSSDGLYEGGLIGELDQGSKMKNSYTVGFTANSGTNAGGLVGRKRDSSSKITTITNSYYVGFDNGLGGIKVSDASVFKDSTHTVYSQGNWDFVNVWEICDGKFPRLIWEDACAPSCGNSIIDDGEQCDDGNLIDGDNCNSICEIEKPICSIWYGNNVPVPNQIGNTPWGYVDECSSNPSYPCAVYTSSSGIISCNGEFDPSFVGDFCQAGVCLTQGNAVCGNNVLDSGENCDDGNLIDGDGCNRVCQIVPVCGDYVCHVGEDTTCPNDCLSCDGYAELTASRSVLPTTNESTPLELTLNLYSLAKTRSNLLEQKAIERKQVMLKLAEEEPAAFLQASIPNEDRDTIFSSVKQYIEKSETLEGRLEVFERPHLSEDGTNIVENAGFDYFLKVGTQRFEVKFAASGSNAISGTEVITKGIILDSFIVVSSGTSKNFEIIKEADRSVNQGVQKIAIILTKPIGASDPNVPLLETHMIETNNYYQEISYGRASLEWDVYGWYETNSTYNYFLAADPDVNFSQYSRIISVDGRNCLFGCASVGMWGYDTDDGFVEFSRTRITPYGLQFNMGAIQHELGHNFGVYHANRLDCGDQTFDIRSNCISIEYRDFFDVMGAARWKGHMNSFHKEIIGWIGDNEIVEVNSDGTYVLEAYEILGDKMVLKIPRKIDEFGIPDSYYYLEYRTPIGFDSFITETQPNNGPQIRIFGNFPGGRSPSQLLDMTPESYPLNEGISVGQTFTDPFTGTTISVVSLTESAATIQVSLTNQQCIRRDPTLIITPINIEGHGLETFYYNFELINNDEIICSDREIYFYNDELYIYANLRTGRFFYEFYPFFFEAGDIAKGVMRIFPTSSSFPLGIHEITIEVIDIDRGLSGSENLIFTLSNQDFGAFDLSGQDLTKRFSYDSYNYGIYLIDDLGKIHRRGFTQFTADNIEDISQLNTNGVAGFVYAPPWHDISFEILDSFGNVYYAGGVSRIELDTTDRLNFPVFSCPIARDAIAQHFRVPRALTTSLMLLDAYGTVYFLGLNMISFFDCESWDGRTDAYRPGEAHAVMLQPWYRWFYEEVYPITNGYYILSRDGTTYACGNADISYTQYNQPLPENFGLGDKYAVSFALDQENGIAMLDSYGNVYTSGTLTHHGEPAFGESIATDIQLLPESIYGLNAGYGVLATDGRLLECQSSVCEEWQNLHTAPSKSASGPTPPSPSRSSSSESSGGTISAINPLDVVWTETIIVDDVQLGTIEGFSVSLSGGEKLDLTIGGETHSIGVLSLTENTAKILVFSEPQEAVLTIGETRKFEVNGDDRYDLRVTLNSIENGEASFSVSSIDEQILPGFEEQQQLANSNSEELSLKEKIISKAEMIRDSSTKFIIITLIVLIITILIGISIAYFIKLKK